MEQSIINQYEGQDKLKAYRMPHDNIDPAEKEKMAYYVAVLKYLFTLGVNGKLHTGFDTKKGCFRKYRELRSYAKGEVPVIKYKKELNGFDSKGNQREKSYMNISWRQDTGHVKTRDQMRGVYEKMDFEMIVKAVDPSSERKRNEEIAGMKIWLNKTFKQFTENMGVELQKPKQDFEDEESIDLYVKAGGLKLQTEIAMKKAIDCTLSESKWRVLKMQLMDDLIDLGIVMSKDYTDLSDNIPMIRYVDPEYAFIPYSKYLDFRDITMGAELRTMTIADIRNESKLTENELRKVAKCYGFSDAFNTVGQEKFKEGNGYYPYDHIKVDVLDGAWLSSDLEKYTEKTIERYGNMEYKKRDYNYQLQPEDAKAGMILHEKRIQYTYEGKWIVGTDFGFGYGRQDYQIKKGNTGYKKAILPFHVATTGTMSKIERMIPDVDTINICKFKRNNALASIPAPPGLVFNKTALENTELDGEIKTPIDLIHMFVEEGVLTIDTSDSHGNPIANINSLVTTVPVTVFEQFKVFSAQIAEARLNIQLTTGINDMADGSADSERMLKAQGEAKLEAANNAMQPEYAMMRETTENTLTSIMLRWQEVVREKPFSKEYMPINEADIDILTISEDISDVKFGLKVNIGSTYQERQMLLQRITAYADARSKAGTGGISEDARFMLERVIMTGNISLAQLLIGKAVKEQQKLDAQIRESNIRMTGEEQRASAKTTAQLKEREIILQAGVQMVVAHNQYILDANLEAVKADLKDGVLDNEALRQQMLSITEGIKPDIAQLTGILGGQQQQNPVQQTA